MARADELDRDDRIRHPTTGETVTVDHVTIGLSWAKVHFKAKGERGWFKVLPHTEIMEIL